MVCTYQVAEAAVGALERSTAGTVPVEVENWTWHRLLHAVAEGLGVRRRVVPVPRLLAEPAAARMGATIRRRGGYTGIDTRHLMRDVMYREMYLDTDVAHDLLGMRRDGWPRCCTTACAASTRIRAPDRPPRAPPPAQS